MKGATWDEWEVWIDESVSIHAPVKGATTPDKVICQEVKVSIHAPVKGATDVGAGWQVDKYGFNPRTREGCDAKENLIHTLNI